LVYIISRLFIDILIRIRALNVLTGDV